MDSKLMREKPCLCVLYICGVLAYGNTNCSLILMDMYKLPKRHHFDDLLHGTGTCLTLPNWGKTMRKTNREVWR